MKKFGFTLAEVLITLGIIGVVAALTAPALVQNAGTAKVGPTLAKVVSTLELANEQILKDEEATKLSSVAENSDEYMEFLSKYVSGSSYDTELVTPSPTWTTYEKEDFNIGGVKEFKFSDNISVMFSPALGDAGGISYSPKGSFKGHYFSCYVDINGINKAPNSFGKDLFIFLIDESGQVIPAGGTTYGWLREFEGGAPYADSSNGNIFACNEDVVYTGKGCAGSIFENNLKVIYQ